VTEAVQDRPAGAARAANLALRFLLELAALAGLAYWGCNTGHSAVGDVALGIAAPLAAAAVSVLAALFAALVVLNTVLLHVWEGEPKP
jgi:hypothetical protein